MTLLFGAVALSAVVVNYSGESNPPAVIESVTKGFGNKVRHKSASHVTRIESEA